jgi:hypothetical protein
MNKLLDILYGIFSLGCARDLPPWSLSYLQPGEEIGRATPISVAELSPIAA